MWNAVKHGGRSPISLIVTENEAGTTLQLSNTPGPNHSHMVALQSSRGTNWLLQEKAESFAISQDKIGRTDSSFQGMRDVRAMIKHLKGTGRIDFHPNGVMFKITVPRMHSLPSPHTPSIQDTSALCVLCADDQNAPRLQVLSAITKLGIPLDQTRTMQDVKGGLFRDEPQVKLFGRVESEVKGPVWEAVVAEWKGKPAVLILDENLDFGSELIKGTDIFRSLRSQHFRGVIAIRSGNDSREDTAHYLMSGADAVLSKTMNVDALAAKIQTLGTMARARCMHNADE